MKTIILSDIQGNRESIIPYGLRFGKHTGTEVEIVHTVDPRAEQATSSPYANSQHISPGEMLSHDNIIQREKYKAQMALQKLVSGEGSRLNYPLKIELKISEGSPGSLIRKLAGASPDSILLATSEPEGSMVENLDELLEITEPVELPVLFVPPEYPFSEPKNTMLMTDFKQTDYQGLNSMIRWLVPFHSNIHAFTLAGSTGHLQEDLEGAAWKKTANTFLDPPMKLDTTVLDYGDPMEKLVHYMKLNGSDLLMVERTLLKGRAGSRFSKKRLKRLMTRINHPVALL